MIHRRSPNAAVILSQLVVLSGGTQISGEIWNCSKKFLNPNVIEKMCIFPLGHKKFISTLGT